MIYCTTLAMGSFLRMISGWHSSHHLLLKGSLSPSFSVINRQSSTGISGRKRTQISQAIIIGLLILGYIIVIAFDCCYRSKRNLAKKMYSQPQVIQGIDQPMWKPGPMHLAESEPFPSQSWDPMLETDSSLKPLPSTPRRLPSIPRGPSLPLPPLPQVMMTEADIHPE